MVCAAMKEWKARLASIVEDGIANGEIRGEVQSRRVANMIIATLEGALMISRLEGNRTAVQDAREGLEIVLDKIVAGPSA